MEIRYENKFNDSIKINSKPSSLRLYDLEGRDGLSNDLSLSKTTYIDGVNVDSATIGSRELTIVGKIITSNKFEIEAIKRNLIRTFTVKDSGTLYYKDNETSKEYCIDVIINNAPVFSQSAHSVIDFIIELVAPIPYWKDSIEAKTEIAQTKGSFHFPLNLPTIMGYKQPNLIVNCNNLGDVETGMRIEFIAINTITNPSLFDVNTREYLKINKVMQLGEKIVINTNRGQKSITSIIDGVETKILHLIDFDSTFLQLSRGDNLLRYQADEGIEFLTCNIYYSFKYLGV